MKKTIDKLTTCLMEYGWSKPKNKLAPHQKDPKYLLDQLKLIESVNPQLSVKLAKSITNAYNTCKRYHFNHINNKPGWERMDGRNDRKKIEYIFAGVSYITAVLTDVKNYHSKDYYFVNGKPTDNSKEFLSRYNNVGKIKAKGKKLINQSKKQNKARAPKKLKANKPKSKPVTFENILKSII